jgi:hypothetical protein
MFRPMFGIVSKLSIFVSCIVIVACSSSTTPSSPAAPSTSMPAASTSPTAGNSSGATIYGTVATTALGPARVSTRSVGMTVSITGTSIVTSVGADGSFTLAGVPPGSAELHFSGGSTDARGTLSGIVDQARITISVVISGGIAQLNVQTSEAEGTISGLTGACPAMTFMIGTTKVSTDSTTIFDGGTCQQLANGGKAEVKGAKQADGSIKAARVSVEEAPQPEPTEVEGTISGLTGACPAVTFMIGTTKVVTDSTTTFAGGTCQQLANGGKADVRGTRQPDGSIKAAKVSVEETPHPEPAEVEGTISGLAGACPAVTFMVGTTKVVTDSTTMFSDGTCQQLANGRKTEVTGSKQPDGSIKATRVSVEEVPQPEPTEVDGKISGLAGACPSVTFTIGTTKVSTDATTKFSDGTCQQLANGGKVEVKGAKQPDGSIKASELSLDRVD